MESKARTPGAERDPGARRAAFADILCGVDGSRGSEAAVGQAIAMASPDGAVTFLAISREMGVGLVATAELSERRARKALVDAADRARRSGVDHVSDLRMDGAAVEVLLDEAALHDLLVIGSHDPTRRGGIMLGSTATQAVHRTQRPLMIARGKAERGDFPTAVLLASNGSPESWAAARMTARLAGARGSDAAIVHIPHGRHPEWTRQIDKQRALIRDVTGADPALLDGPGRTPERVAEEAAEAGSSVIVIGHRGLEGVKALGSVSERIVHRAPCSVLIVPPDMDEG